MLMLRLGALIFSLVLLIGCGGGGGGGSSQRHADMTPPEPSPPEISRSDVQTSDPEAIRDEADKAANSPPRFGSIFQSNETLTGISSSFDGRRLTVSVQRAAGDPIGLDTADAILDYGVGPSLVELTGRSSREWAVLNVAGSEDSGFAITIGRVAVDWANGDPDDYLSGGYWLNIEGNILAGEITNVGIGAFIDGPEIDLSNPATLPVLGTATYRGTAAGIYVGIYGTDVPSLSAGSAEVGEFSGIAKLTADFSDSTISGCVGCEGNVLLSGVARDSITGDIYAFDNTPSDIQIHLGSAPISSDGSFSQADVTATSGTLSIRNSSGFWGGRFSSIQDAEGDPRLVAGTFGGGLSTHGGTEAVYLGAFGAGKQ